MLPAQCPLKAPLLSGADDYEDEQLEQPSGAINTATADSMNGSDNRDPTIVSVEGAEDHDGGQDAPDQNGIIRGEPSRLTLARTFYEEHCIYLPAMLGWFFFSSLLSAYNKVVFGQNRYHFPCPLLMTSIHFLAQWGFAYAASEAAPEYFGASRLHQMSWREWAATSIPCGTVTSGDVGLSNLSLVRISITFYTMIKASTPIFVLAWAYCLGIEKITIALVAVVMIIAVGEFLTVTGEGGDLDVVGFLLCLTASFLSGARWTVVQLKLRTMEPPLKTTIATMRLISPSMFVSLFFMSLAIEEPWNRLAGDDMLDVSKVLGLGLIGASFAISMVLCEFYLIMRANAIVLMIGGVLKEMLTILIGVRFFDDKLNKINISGCAVVFLGVLLYKVTHYMDAQKSKLEASYQATRTDNMEDENDAMNGGDGMNTSGSGEFLLKNPPYEKSGSGIDFAAEIYKDVTEGDGLLHVPGSEGIELRRKQVIATEHPSSPKGNGHHNTTNGLNSSNDQKNELL